MKQETKEYLTTQFPKEYTENTHLALINLAEHINNKEREYKSQIGKLHYQLAELKTRKVLQTVVEEMLLPFHTGMTSKCQSQLGSLRGSDLERTKEILDHMENCSAMMDKENGQDYFADTTKRFLDAVERNERFPQFSKKMQSAFFLEDHTTKVLLPHSLRHNELRFMVAFIIACHLEYKVIGEDGHSSEYFVKVE